MSKRYFNSIKIDGEDGIFWLMRDGTGRYVWEKSGREQIGGCYETKAEARADILTFAGAIPQNEEAAQ